MQGTNAHAVVEQPTSGYAQQHSLAASTLLWQQKRHWIANPAHALLTQVIFGREPKTAIMVADLTSARAAVFVQGMRLHDKAMASLDLYLEVMAGAVQQLNPTATTQLTSVTATSMASLDDKQQQLTVTVHGAAVAISAGNRSPEHVCCQAVVCINSKIQSSTAISAQSQHTALQQVLLAETHSRFVPQPAATAVITPAWDCSQGFCLPVAATTATAQLQACTAASAQPAVVPTAVCCVSVSQTAPTALLHIAAAVTAKAQADASVLTGCSSACATQLKGVKLSPANSLAQATQTEASKNNMLFQKQWAVTTPSTAATQLQHFLVPSRPVQALAVCASLMAMAQQAAQAQQAGFHMSMTATEPVQAMTVAMLRSVAQENSSMTCTACTACTTVNSSFCGVSIASSTSARLPLVSRLSHGMVYQPSLMQAEHQQLDGEAKQGIRSCIVLGGTGSIGSLVGTWLSGGGVCEVVLVGRTGKLSEASAPNFAKLLAGQAVEDCVTMVTLARCDAATAEEASWLYRQSSPEDRCNMLPLLCRRYRMITLLMHVFVSVLLVGKQ